MSLRVFCCWIALLSILLSIPVMAGAVQPGNNAPRVGVALEGGAALGLAHIGVLQWMEEHHIPIYYVAGTSMGGLVGGMYATGNNPEEMKAFINKINWDDVLSGQTAFQNLTYRRKEDATEYPNRLEFGIRDGVRFPEGFNAGHEVGLILDQIALPYSEMKSFNDLPIPFACVATDLVSKKQYIFREGSLGQALRSTMSLPGVFTPVRTDNHVFVDGALLENLPVDVAKQLGADIVIAIHLEVKPMAPTDHLSSFGVLGESLSVMIAANELRSMEKADVLVSVPLAAYDGMDYSKGPQIIKLGYEAAEGKAAILSRFSVDDATWQAYVAERASRKRTAPVPQFVEVNGTKPQLANEIEHQLSDDVGKPVDIAQLDSQLNYLTGVGRFSRLGYYMVEKNGKQGLMIQADEKEYSPPIVNPLVDVDGTNYDRPQFIIGGRVTFLDVGGFGSEWRNDLLFGSEYGIHSEYFHPVHESRFFVAPYAFAFNREQDYYHDSTLTAEYRDRQGGGGLDLGFLFTRKDELRVGYQAAYRRLSPSVGTSIFGTIEGRVGATSLQFNHIGRDEPVIPSRGLDINFTANFYDANPGATENYPAVQARYIWFVPVSKTASVFTVGTAGSTFGYMGTGIPPFSLGGSRDLLAYGQNEFLTQQYYLFKAGYVHPLWYLPPMFGKNISVIATYEVGKVFYTQPGISSIPTDVAAGLVVDSLFGPVEVGYGYGATGHHKFFYRIGRIF